MQEIEMNLTVGYFNNIHCHNATLLKSWGQFARENLRKHWQKKKKHTGRGTHDNISLQKQSYTEMSKSIIVLKEYGMV